MGSHAASTGTEELVIVGPQRLRGRWAWTPGSSGAVVVVQASRRLGPGSVALISVLRERSKSWLRLVLQAPGELPAGGNAAAIARLGERVLQGMAWLRTQPYTARTRIGLFGEGPAASVALWVASQHPPAVDALVLCSGQFNLEAIEASRATAPTLLIAAGLDPSGMDQSRQVASELRCARRLEIVPNAKRGLAQPGTLDTVAHLAAGWFESRLRDSSTS